MGVNKRVMRALAGSSGTERHRTTEPGGVRFAAGLNSVSNPGTEHGGAGYTLLWADMALQPRGGSAGSVPPHGASTTRP